MFVVCRTLSFALALLVASSVRAGEALPCLPFVGETLVFSVGWEFINAGTASLQVRSPKSGQYRIHTAVRTNAFLDMFKKVRDTIIAEGVCQNSMMRSTRFVLQQQERSYHAKKITVFDRKQGVVRYTEHGKTDVYPVSLKYQDVMDAFFMVRNMDLHTGQVIHLPIFDSRKSYDVAIHIGTKTKRIRAPWGERVACISIEPQLKTAGIFSSQGKVKIWVTDDARHIPLKLIAKIKIGHIIGRLTKYQEPL